MPGEQLPDTTLVSTQTVLIIDDEPTIARMIGQVLAHLPYRILTAYDAESGAQIIEAEEPDMVIVDVKLSGMDGVELSARVKSERPTTRVLLISAHSEPPAHTGDAFIAKPFDNEHLIATVQRYLEV